jgi:hypothetical protein
MQIIGVERHDLELIGALAHAIEHDQVMYERVLAPAVEAQRAAVTRF